MKYKENFNLLKGVPNVLNVSGSVLTTNVLKDGHEKIRTVLGLTEKSISHFTKEKVMKFVNSKNFKNDVIITNLDNYNIPITYNIKTKQIIINLTPLEVDDITAVKPDPRVVYALVVYGMIFSHIIRESKINISYKTASTIVNFYLSMFVRIFGKKYGLVGAYSTEIPKVKFLLAVYILVSFFKKNADRITLNEASAMSQFNYREMETELSSYDFDNFNDLIKALSDFNAMPGLNKYNFTADVLRQVGMTFLPAFEDMSRFFSIMTVSSIPGSTLIPGHISRYNEPEYRKLVGITLSLFNNL